MGGVKFPKPRTSRNSDYLAFVRTLPCVICEAPYAVPHHAGDNRGMALKCSDTRTIPLCTRCHTEMHQKGVITFQLVHNFDVKDSIIQTLERYIMENT